MVVVAVVGVYWAWGRWGSLATQHARFQLSAGSIDIPPQPQWIQADVRAEVFRDANLGQLSLLDPDAAPRIDRAFTLHTWVLRVERTRKKSDGRIFVQLRYRRPILMVETVPDGFWPVDTEGVLLPPEEFSEFQTRDYLHVGGVNSQPVGQVGTPFGDDRVAAAAKIAVVLQEVWRDLGIRRIEPSKTRRGSTLASSFFELATRQGTRIVWGSVPGSERAGEVPAVEKVQRLIKFVHEHGSLEGPSTIDLTQATGVEVTPRMARRRN